MTDRLTDEEIRELLEVLDAVLQQPITYRDRSWDDTLIAAARTALPRALRELQELRGLVSNAIALAQKFHDQAPSEGQLLLWAREYFEVCGYTEVERPAQHAHFKRCVEMLRATAMDAVSCSTQLSELVNRWKGSGNS